MGALILALLLAGPAGAEVTTRVRGVVLEPGTNQPVTGAEVTASLRDGGRARVNGVWKYEDYYTVESDENGRFFFEFDRPGVGLFEVKKRGYVTPVTDQAVSAKLTAEQPESEVRLFLTRPGRLTGSVVDSESGQPAKAGLRVARWTESGLELFHAAPVEANAAGEFAAERLRPGEFAVEVGPRTEAKLRIRTRFSQTDADEIDRDFARSYWPPGGGLDDVAPVAVGAGATVSLGRIAARRTNYYRARVRFSGFDCAVTPSVYLMQSTRLDSGWLGWSMEGVAEAPCAPEWLVTGFAPGTYRLIFTLRGSNRSAVAAFEIVDKNVTVGAVVAAPIAIDGEVVAAHGAKRPDLRQAYVMLRAAESGSGSSLSDGKFRVEGLRPVEHTVVVSRLDAQHYVKELRYNGVAFDGDVLPLDEPAETRRLEIVIDDNPALIAGTASAGGALVVARRWPPNPRQRLAGTAAVNADEAGRFRLTGLAPGEYRVVAVRSLSEDTMRTDAVARALAANGVRVEVGPNGVASVELKAVDVR